MTSAPRARSLASVRARAAAVVLTVAGGLSLALAGTVGPAACTSTTAINESLVSGIFVPSSILLDNNYLQCGQETSDQVYKYIAVALNGAADVAGAGIFDCYSEAVFANLPGTDGGALNFALWIYAYNYTAYTAANQGNSLVDAVDTLNGVNHADGSVQPFLAKLPIASRHIDGGPLAAALAKVCLTPATWVTTCSATAQASVQALANCTIPMALQTSVPTDCNLPVRLPDGG